MGFRTNIDAAVKALVRGASAAIVNVPADALPSRPEADGMTIPGKGGRPKGERFNWLVKLWPDEGERIEIRAACERRGVTVGGTALRLLLEWARTPEEDR